jgi:hypothetical protein
VFDIFKKLMGGGAPSIDVHNFDGRYLRFRTAAALSPGSRYRVRLNLPGEKEVSLDLKVLSKIRDEEGEDVYTAEVEVNRETSDLLARHFRWS